MLVLGVNKVLNWCQVLSNGRKYTCPTKVVDGELCFAFKKGGIVLESIFQNTQRNLYQKVAKHF